MSEREWLEGLRYEDKFPAPYYQDDFCTIYHGDCREIAPLRFGGSSRLVTDPSYKVRPPLRHWCQSWQTVAVFAYPELLVSWCVKEEVFPAEWITWWPTTPRASSGGDGLPKVSECVAVFGDVVGGQDLTRERTGGDEFLKQKDARRGNNPMRARLGDVWRDPAPGIGFNSHVRLHPNQKPVSLMHNLIRLCSAPGDVVLDPFMGSGTTLRAAKDLGRHSIGIEIEERYCEIAANRLAQEVLAL